MKLEKTDLKRIWMYRKIENLKKNFGNEFIQLFIRKAEIYHDSFEQIKTIQHFELLKQIKISYENEDAQDAGGLFRDWLTLLIKEILKPENGLFLRSDTEGLTYIINRFSHTKNDNHLQQFYFFGQIIGKALLERVPVSAFLNSTIFKYLLDMKIEYNDLEFYDLQIYISLNYLIENTINKNELNTEFVVREMDKIKNEMVENELIENGKKVLVDDENKFDFISKV